MSGPLTRSASCDVVAVCAPDGTCVRRWDAYYPTGICFGAENRVFVRCRLRRGDPAMPSDSTADRPCVKMFTDDGWLLATFSLGSLGAGSYDLGLAADTARGRLYVADRDHTRIFVFELT